MGDTIDIYTLGRSSLPGDEPDDAGQDIWMVSRPMNPPIWRGKYAAGEREAESVDCPLSIPKKKIK